MEKDKLILFLLIFFIWSAYPAYCTDPRIPTPIYKEVDTDDIFTTSSPSYTNHSSDSYRKQVQELKNQQMQEQTQQSVEYWQSWLWEQRQEALREKEEQQRERKAAEARKQSEILKNKKWLDSLDFPGSESTTPKLLRTANESNEEFSSLEKTLNSVETPQKNYDVQAKIQERITEVQLDIERIQTGLSGLTKSLLNNKDEFDKWHDSIDDAFKTALKSCFEYPADILPGRVDELIKSKIAFNNEIKEKIIELIKTTIDENQKKLLIDTIKALDDKSLKLEHFNNLSSLLSNSKAISDLYDLDENKDDEYKKYLDGAIMYGDIVVNAVADKSPLGSAKVIATSYSDITSEIVGWYKINKLDYDNDKYMDAVADLNDRMKVKVAELKYFKGCLANSDENAQSSCFNYYKTPKTVVPPLRKTR